MSSEGVCQVVHPLLLIPEEVSGGMLMAPRTEAYEGEERVWRGELPRPPIGPEHDLQQLGALLYEVVTGHPPWPVDTRGASA